MAAVRLCLLITVLVVPFPLYAQGGIPADTKLADVLLRVYESEIVANVEAGADPLSAISDLADALLITQAIGSQLSTFPLGSSAGGFVWSFTEATGTLSRASNSFGPIFAERALTVGRGRLNLGLNYQRTTFDSFEGRGLKDREVVFYTPFPTDLIGEDALELDLETETVGVFLGYGVTDRLDIGAVVPFVRTTLRADLRFRFLNVSGTQFGTLEEHSFGGGTATGLSDIVARAKYRLYDLDGGGVAVGVDLRLPTGDEENLLGIPGTQAKMYGVVSATIGAVSPHVNVGYTFSRGNDLVTDPETPFLEPPDEFTYTVGADVVVAPRLTVAVDLIGRRIRDLPRLEFGDVGLGSTFEEFSFSDVSTLNVLLAATGAKFNLGGNLLVSANLLFPLSDGGLKPNVTPVVGFDYSF